MKYFTIQIADAAKTSTPTPAAPTIPETTFPAPTEQGKTMAIYNQL